MVGRHVRQHETARAGTTGVLAGLRGGEVPAVTLVLRLLERRLEHQQVGVTCERDDRVVG